MKALIIEPLRKGWEIAVLEGLPDNSDDAAEIAESEISNNGEYFLFDDKAGSDVRIVYKKYDETADIVTDNPDKPSVTL